MNRFYMIILCIVTTLMSQVSWAQGEYRRIQPHTAISVVLKGVAAEEAAKVSGEYMVGSDGTIKPPYLDRAISLRGKTSREAEDLLSRAYQDAQIFSKPAFIVSFASNEATQKAYVVDVSGHVNKPGPISFREGLTLGGALSAAGDINIYGSRKVQLTRKGSTRTYDAFNSKDRSILLQPGDQLFVLERGIWEGRPAGIK